MGSRGGPQGRGLQRVNERLAPVNNKYATYNAGVTVHVDSTTPVAYALTASQSRDLLNFCRSIGATVFTANFLFVKGEESERLAQAF